jgi:hypothetical protein
MTGTSSPARDSLTDSSLIYQEQEFIKVVIISPSPTGHTFVCGKATEERKYILDSLSRCDLVKGDGKGVNNEDPMKGSFTAREQVYLFECAESFVVNCDIGGFGNYWE